MGLGKTRTALYAAKLAGLKRLSIVAPPVVHDHWRNEAALIDPSLDLVTESYHRLVMNASARAGLLGRDALILDEVHFLKHRDSMRTKLMLGTGTGLAHHFPIVWGLSGTPMPRNPTELWPIMYAFWRRALEREGVRSYMDFVERFTVFTVRRDGVKVFAAKNVPQLRALLAPILLRQRTEDVAPDLPPLRWEIETITAPDVAAVLDEQGRLDDGIRHFLENGRIPSSVDERAYLAKLRHKIGDVKAYAAVELLKDELEIDHGKRVVFAFHHSVLDVLDRGLASYGVVRIDGSRSAAARSGAVAAFRQDDSTRVLLAQIGAAGTGLDGLQYASHLAVFVEFEWDGSVNVQAGGRLARMGQTLPVQARMLSLAGTLDEAIVRSHLRDIKMVKEVIG